MRFNFKPNDDDDSNRLALRSPKTIRVKCSLSTDICMCITCARECVCFFLLAEATCAFWCYLYDIKMLAGFGQQCVSALSSSLQSRFTAAAAAAASGIYFNNL